MRRRSEVGGARGAACGGRRGASAPGGGRERTALLALSGAVVAAAAYPRLLRAALRFNLARLRAGDSGPLVRFYSDDVRFRFPGTSSWAADIGSKRELSAWIDEFVAIGLQLHADEIVVSGPPWRTTFCLRCTDELRDEDGTVVYENRAVLWGHARWGLVRDYEVYEDTERSLALDAWLAERRATAA
jgi:hypothetical protein